MRPSHVLALAVAAAAGLAGPATRPAGAVLLAPATADVADPAVAVAPDGRAVAAWTQRLPGRPERYVVAVRALPTPLGSWGPPVRLSAPTPRRPGPPRVAIGSRGDAAVLWQRAGGAIEAAVRVRPAGAWRRPLVVARGRAPWSSPDLAIGPAGAVVAAWGESSPRGWRLHRAGLQGARGAPWSRGTGPLAASPPSIAVGERGEVLAAWTVPADPARQLASRVRATWREADATGWARPAVIAAAAGQPAVAVGAGGRGAVAYEDVGGGNPVVRLAERPAGGGAWRAGDVPAAAGRYPHVALGAGGTTLLAWAETSPRLRVRVSVRPPDGPFGAPETVYGGFSFFSLLELADLRVAVDGRGVPYVAFLDPEGPGSAAALVGRRAGEGPGWRITRLEVGEDRDQIALGAGGAGAWALAPRVSPRSEPNVELTATPVA